MARSKTKITLDSSGMAAVLKSAGVAQAVRSAANHVASAVEKDAEIGVTDYQTDRAASSVTIIDPRGKIWQARDGVLTRAALAAGLDVGGVS